jgi:hypothetical protein
LPFLSDVRSPIAREQYVREIAQRLSVSETAVSEALAKVPLAPEFAHMNSKEQEKRATPPKADRARQAFALLLWQQSLAKPSINIEAFEKEFKDTIGMDGFKKLSELPENEKESLRFEAEKQYVQSRSLGADAQMQLRELLRTERLPEIHEEIRLAQERGDQDEVERLQGVYNLLKTRIAHLREAA